MHQAQGIQSPAYVLCWWIFQMLSVYNRILKASTICLSGISKRSWYLLWSSVSKLYLAPLTSRSTLYEQINRVSWLVMTDWMNNSTWSMCDVNSRMRGTSNEEHVPKKQAILHVIVCFEFDKWRNSKALSKSGYSPAGILKLMNKEDPNSDGRSWF